MADIEIFTGPNCGYCREAKRLLDAGGYAYREHDVSQPDAQALMRARLPRARSIPQIFVDGVHLGGSDDLAARLAQGPL
ncbi:MAG: glutaredoxin 3 [Alphaproteobacteria bacterium HGW-Alphaproteobacteria-8]|nr:MAG: glutaredoxin 3 [Alphaproteobacteria bacterium HGW-Alphaproteobacteria-8]